MNKFEARALRFMGLEVLLKAPPRGADRDTLMLQNVASLDRFSLKSSKKELDLGRAEGGREVVEIIHWLYVGHRYIKTGFMYALRV